MNKKYFLLTCLAAFPFALTAQENNRYEEDYQPQADKHQPGACPQHVHLLRHGG